MGRSVIGLRGLCNAERQVLCDSQAGFSLYPQIVNVNTKTPLLLHRTQFCAHDQVMFQLSSSMSKEVM